MVKLAVLFAVGLSALTSLVVADNCKGGLAYCGYGLLNKGNYYNEIVAELQENGQGVDPKHVTESLFNCGGSGSIRFNKYCGSGCHDGGSGNSDRCK
ncbi:MAG: hypothetical protein Q9211_002377 [Gyalolechia sp. 1 TL-2023]